MNDDKLICPYCKKEQYTHTDDEISADMCFMECEHCNKNCCRTEIIMHYAF